MPYNRNLEHVECESHNYIWNSRGQLNHLIITQTITQQHTSNERNQGTKKTAILNTAHFSEPVNMKVQNINSMFITCILNNKCLYYANVCTHKYLLNYSMVQSPSWEANWSAASQETPRISRNPKVHYRTHKRPPPDSILGQPNPVHIHTSHFLEIHFNIIRPSTPRSPSGLLPSGFPTKTLHTPSPHPYVPHAQPISFFSILLPAKYWVRSTNHLAPPYATSYIPQSPLPS